MENTYTVYLHENKINNKKYIGITHQKPKYRWKNGRGYKSCILFNKAIQKYGWENFNHIILFENLSKEEAEQKEIELISFFKSNQKKYGYNIENGGNSIGKLAEETKEKMRKAKKTFRHTEETKRKIGLKCKERYANKENHPMYGKPHSKETKEKISNSNKKKINQYDLDGNFIKTWNSAIDVEKELGIDSCHINSVANGKQYSCHNYIWKYEKEKKINSYNNKQIKSINQYDLDGNFIRNFKKMSDIKNEYGYGLSHISQCCKNKRKKAYGYIWRYNGKK